MRSEWLAVAVSILALGGWVVHSFGAPNGEEVALSTRHFANHQPPDSTVAAWGVNPGYMLQGPDDISLVWALESNYQPNPADPNQHLAEFYVQFHGRDEAGAYFNRRPLLGSIERETGRTDVGLTANEVIFRGEGVSMGRMTDSQGNAPPRWELPPTGYLAQMTPDAPAVMGWGPPMFQMLGSLGTVTRVGQPGGDGVRIEGAPFFAWSRPTATTCAELGAALDAMGLVNWQPSP